MDRAAIDLVAARAVKDEAFIATEVVDLNRFASIWIARCLRSFLKRTLGMGVSFMNMIQCE